MKWRSIKNSKYIISEYGQVKNKLTGHILKLHPGGTSPYLLVNIKINDKISKSYLVHRLVALSFIKNIDNKAEVNHKDGDKLNNHYSNLEWTTSKENMNHAITTGLYKRFNNQIYKGKFGKNHNRSKPIYSNGIFYEGLSDASRKTGIGLGLISYSLKNVVIVKNKYLFQYV